MANLLVDPVCLMGSVLRFCTSTEVPWLTIPSTGSWTLWALATSAFDDLDVYIYILYMYTFIYVYIIYTVYIYMKMRYVYEYIYIFTWNIYTSDGASPSKWVGWEEHVLFVWDQFAGIRVTFHIVCGGGLNGFLEARSSRWICFSFKRTRDPLEYHREKKLAMRC